MMGNKQRRLNIKALLRRNWLLMSTIVSVVLGTCKPVNLSSDYCFSLTPLLLCMSCLAKQGVHAFNLIDRRMVLHCGDTDIHLSPSNVTRLR